MKKLFTLISLLGAFGMAGAQEQTPEVTLDFTGSNAYKNWSFMKDGSATNVPTSSTNDYNNITTVYTNGSYSMTYSPGTGSCQFYRGKTTYDGTDKYWFHLGTTGATLTLSAFDFNVSKIEIVGASNSSSSVQVNVVKGENAISTQVNGGSTYTEDGISTYKLFSFNIPAANQADGSFTVKVINNARLYIHKILIYAAAETQDISSVGYASFVPRIDVNIPSEGVTAYYLSAGNLSDGVAAMSPATGTLKKGEAVILKGEEGSVTFTPATEAASDIDGNILKSFKYSTPENTDNTYVFGMGKPSNEATEKVAGFFKYGFSSKPSNGIYFTLPPSVQSAPTRGFGIDFGDGETTAIENLEIEKLSDDEASYNLQGQKVGADYKGLVIKNGKKMIIK